MDATTLNVIITSGISVFGAGLSFLGAQKGAKTQIETTEKSVENNMEIAKMNIEEKLIAENKINWNNRTRELISKFIRQCFDINHGIDQVQIINKKRELSVDPSLPSKERNKYSNLSKEDLEMAKKTLVTISDAVETVTEIRLHIFDRSDSLGNELLERIIDVEKYFQRMEKIPSKELSRLTELARNYFELQWKELTKDIR